MRSIRMLVTNCALNVVGLMVGLNIGHAQENSTVPGKPMILINGYAPGSGNDPLGRLVAAHLGRHLPGTPNIVAQNMPGAGTFRLANYMYSAAPRDGSVIGYISQTAATQELLKNPSVQFKTSAFNWLGRISTYNIVAATWRSSRVRSVEDALRYQSTIGATGVGSTVYIYPDLMNKVLGTKFKIVSGYEGTHETALAMERGEVEGIFTGWFTLKTMRKEWLRDSKVNIIAQFVATRDADLPDVPSIVEFARTPVEKSLFRLITSEGDIGKSIFAPPQTPSSAVATLRRGFAEMLVDRSFVGDAANLQIEISPLSGDQLQTLIQEVANTPPDVIAFAEKILKQ